MDGCPRFDIFFHETGHNFHSRRMLFLGMGIPPEALYQETLAEWHVLVQKIYELCDLHGWERLRDFYDYFDVDGDVHGDDCETFDACATGPAVPYDPLPAGCELSPDGQGLIAADLDGDGDVDQSDFGLFQRCLSGPREPADPACAD